MRILVAEDNLVFQWGLRSMLTQWGYDVVVVSDGEEAWQQLQDDEGPRLAILDWLMPGMDGIEVCRRVRASNQTSYTYIRPPARHGGLRCGFGKDPAAASGAGKGRASSEIGGRRQAAGLRIRPALRVRKRPVWKL